MLVPAVTLHSPNGLCCSVLCCSNTTLWLRDLHHGSICVGTATLTEQCFHGTVNQCKWPSRSATVRLVMTKGCRDTIATLVAVCEPRPSQCTNVCIGQTYRQVLKACLNRVFASLLLYTVSGMSAHFPRYPSAVCSSHPLLVDAMLCG